MKRFLRKFLSNRVFAIDDGTVKSVAVDYGGRTKVLVAGEYHTAVYYMQRCLLREGEDVRYGDVIGVSK